MEPQPAHKLNYKSICCSRDRHRTFEGVVFVSHRSASVFGNCCGAHANTSSRVAPPISANGALSTLPFFVYVWHVAFLVCIRGHSGLWFACLSAKPHKHSVPSHRHADSSRSIEGAVSTLICSSLPLSLTLDWWQVCPALVQGYMS